MKPSRYRSPNFEMDYNIATPRIFSVFPGTLVLRHVRQGLRDLWKRVLELRVWAVSLKVFIANAIIAIMP